MRGIYRIVSLKDVSFIIQKHNDYIKIKHTSQIVDAVYTHDVIWEF